MIGRMDDDLLLQLGDRDRLLATRAGTLLAGELIGDAEPFQAAWARDGDRHGEL